MSGIIAGFGKNPSTPSFDIAIRTIWQLVALFIPMEYMRYNLSRSLPQKYVWWFGLLMCFAFTFIQIDNIAYIFNASYATEIILAAVSALIANLYLYYVSSGGSFWGLAVFRTTVTILPAILPVLPAINKYLAVIILCVVAITGYFLADKNKNRRIIKKKKKNRTMGYLATAAILLVFMLFGIGVFPVLPAAVASNSMKSQIERGSIVIIKKFASKEAVSIEINDVVQYFDGEKSVVHRVIDIREDNLGVITFITKGDDNSSEDSLPIYAEQILGKVLFVIPYIGFPAVWLRELFGS